jgi:hypothetical protein
MTPTAFALQNVSRRRGVVVVIGLHGSMTQRPKMCLQTHATSAGGRLARPALPLFSICASEQQGTLVSAASPLLVPE